jgi:tRNA A-37 threonylcarbamoyl transferase component Bud32
MAEYKLDDIIVERPTKTVYYEDGKTIKLFVENYSKAAILNEALNQARVEESTDLKIPKLQEVTTINGRWALISDHIYGKSFEDMIKENPEKIDEYLDKFIDIQLEVLSKNVPLLNRMKDKYRREITESPEFNDNIRYELLQRLDGTESRYKLCHGDFVPSNIVFSDTGEYYIIDWAHATRGNGASDAANTYLLSLLDGQKDIAEKYLQRFSEKSNIDKIKIQRWIPIVAANQFLKASGERKETLRQWIDVVDYE